MSKKGIDQLSEEIISRYLATAPRGPKASGRPTHRKTCGDKFLGQWDLENLHKILLSGPNHMDLEWYVAQLQDLLARDFSEVSASVKLEVLREIKQLIVLAAGQTPEIDAMIKAEKEQPTGRTKGQGVSPFNLKAAS